jgi:hypothetical protein
MLMSGDKIVSYITFKTIFAAISIFVAYKIFAQIVYNRFFSPLRKFPGPFWGSVTRLWLGWHCWRQTELNAIKRLHEKYGISDPLSRVYLYLTLAQGPVLRITPTLLLVSDSSKLPEIYHRQANKTDHYVTGSCGEVEAVFNMKEHKAHAKFRKVAAGPYSFTNIKKMEPMIDARMEEWADTMRDRFVKSGNCFDLCDWGENLIMI